MDGIQIRIGDLLYAVVKRWKLVLALTAMGLGFGVALYGIAFVQGKNMNYEITCSIAVTSQSATGAFTGNSAYLNPNDFYLAQDMVDAADYVIKSDKVLEIAIANAGLQNVTTKDVSKNLQLERYNETQIVEMTLSWSDGDEGTALLNAILDSARTVLPETLMTGSVAVIDEPTAKYLPGGSVYSGVWLFMAVLGFLAGIGVAVLDLIMRPTLLNLKDVENVLGLETIGVISQNENSFQKKQDLLVKDQTGCSKAEQEFSSTAYILKNMLGSKETQNCFYITSTQTGEGKTTVAANLAIQLSDMGKKVLLLDLDNRNPGLGGIFLKAVDYSRSLNAVYKGEAIPEEAVISLTGYLDFLPMILEHNAIPLDGTLFEFVRQISKGYEYVIIDAPSLEQSSDVLSLSQIAHMVLFVIRYDTAMMQDIQNSIEKLDKSGTRILGCVVNGVQTMGGIGPVSGGRNRKSGKSGRNTKAEKPELSEMMAASEEPESRSSETEKELAKAAENGWKQSRNVLEDLDEEYEAEEDRMTDDEALEALLRIGTDGSWKKDDKDGEKPVD